MHRLALVGVQLLDAHPGERREHFRVELLGGIAQPPHTGALGGLADEPAVLAGAVEQAAPWLESAFVDQGLEIVDAMRAPAAENWAETRSFHHSRFPTARIAAERDRSIAVCLPARECAATVGPIVEALLGLCEDGAIDEVLVVDAASTDGTAAAAEAAGARVCQEADLEPGVGPVLGKGDAMWRALSVIDSEIVCFLDADTADFAPHFATGLLGPLVCERGVAFVKAFYERPFVQAGVSIPRGGGRVNHLLARPALALFYPELAGVRQPLAGEVAATRELLESVPFATGYGVEVGMLIDVWREVGLEGMAQVDLEEHRNRHQPLLALTPMAETVLATIAARLQREGRLQGAGLGAPSEPVLERPPRATLPVA